MRPPVEQLCLKILSTSTMMSTAAVPVNPRVEPIEMLHRNHIKTSLWGEDALCFYQVPTVVFELYLRVPDEELQRASVILSSSPGYRQVPPDTEEMQASCFREVFVKYWSHRFLGSWSDVTGGATPSSSGICSFYYFRRNHPSAAPLCIPQTLKLYRSTRRKVP